MVVIVLVVVVVVSRGRLMGSRRVQRALLTLAVRFLLGVFRECWAGLSVLLGKLLDDAMEQRRRRGGGGGELQKGEEEEVVVVVMGAAVRNNGTRNGWITQQCTDAEGKSARSLQAGREAFPGRLVLALRLLR